MKKQSSLNMQIENQKLLKEVILTHEIWQNENHEFNSYFGGIRNFGEYRSGDTRVLISKEEWKKIHAEKRQIVKETINGLLEAKKVKFDSSIVGLSKSRKIEHIREEREKLQIERNRTIKYSNFDLYDVPRTDWGKVYLRFHPSLEYKAVIDFDKYLEDLENGNQNVFLNDLIGCCRCLQSNITYHARTDTEKKHQDVENMRNRGVRDFLEIRGYEIKDQTQHGISERGKSAGEVDILVKKTINTIIEALNLKNISSVSNTEYLNKHIKKLEDNYDPEGLKEKYLLVYADIKNDNFDRFCENYHTHIDTYSFEFKKTDIKEIPTEEITDTKETITNIKVYQTSHLRESVDVKLFHILVKMPVI